MLSRKDLEERMAKARQDALHLNLAIHTIRKASISSDIRAGIAMIPQCPSRGQAVLNALIKFHMWDITREELCQVLEKEFESRKRAMKRYEKLIAQQQ